jgi:uncharacterized protein YggT (Ycf19 family)
VLLVHKWSVLIGAIAGLLLARLVALLFAARPDNSAVTILLAISAPLVAPFGWLDRLAGQPQWGARLELATLAALAALLIITFIVGWIRGRRTTAQAGEQHAQS